MTMSLPASNDPKWRDVALGKIEVQWSNLAMKILMTRIRRETSADPSGSNVQRCASEIHGFFSKNAAIAANDLRAIFR